MDILAPIAFGAAFLIGIIANAYAHWKVYTLYRLLGDRKKDIDFHSLSVWMISSRGYASWRLGERQIKAFDRLPDELLRHVPIVRRQTELAKKFYFAAAAVFAALLLSLPFR